MGLKNNCYATVWHTDIKEKYADISLSITKKLQNGTYETDFSNKVRFIGKAFQKVKSANLVEKDRVHLLEVETTCKYDKATKRQYLNFICWDCEVPNKEKTNKVEIVDTPLVEEPNENDLPF